MLFISRILIFFYSALLTLGSPLLILRLFWKGRKNPAYKQRWLERFGVFQAPNQPNGVWFHAVSLGETIAATPLIKAFKAQHPDTPIIITTTTPTGSAQVRKSFGDSVFHVYMPYDFPLAIHGFLKRVQPTLAIIMETELWPNVILACNKNHIPLILANARLAEKSCQGYQKIAGPIKYLLNCFETIAVQSHLDGQRFLQLGLSKDKCVVSGNIKFDSKLEESSKNKGQMLREQLGKDRFVWIAASTHQGEDEQILAAHKKVLEKNANALLLLVPRHPERFSQVAELIQSQGISLCRRSERTLNSSEVFLGDTMGEMPLFFAACDAAFVGGSLVPTGGHNLLEPAFAKIPVASGPHTFHFVEMVELFNSGDALTIVKDSDELAALLIEWMDNPELRQSLGNKAYQIAIQNQGAIDKVLDLINGICRGRS